ncbi:DUF3558 domain-containing protein [uncultured Streptomyces sp.]|uniref:DUF3558 domain-containing protein n=1 Tax=uncultured Streptomyces sp. TaxID=174707 RepID=UPI0026094CD0|nr:DUF3558 domain-containing protein [uncultured Streptomyces sp.]
MAYAPGVALLAALVVGCSSGSGTDESADDDKAGGPTVVAAPGRYRTLPEACSSVPAATLRALLPDDTARTEDQRESLYEGTASVTFDTDRKAGCRWKAEADDASRSLTVDFERVVSYDPAVSDDSRADLVYEKAAEAAGLAPAAPDADATGEADASPSGTASPTGTGSPSDAGSGAGTGDGPAAQGSATPAGTPSPTPTTGGSTPADDAAQTLPPRRLTGLANEAFTSDVLESSGSTAQHRTVSVVFRTSNVVVTIRYAEQPRLTDEVPDSTELQEKAQALARTLADRLSE